MATESCASVKSTGFAGGERDFFSVLKLLSEFSRGIAAFEFIVVTVAEGIAGFEKFAAAVFEVEFIEAAFDIIIFEDTALLEYDSIGIAAPSELIPLPFGCLSDICVTSALRELLTFCKTV